MSGWIDVIERIAEDKERVLACYSGDVFFAGYLASLKTCRRDPGGQDQWGTYWMPIPNLSPNRKD